jgi:hypothetical protein
MSDATLATGRAKRITLPSSRATASKETAAAAAAPERSKGRPKSQPKSQRQAKTPSKAPIRKAVTAPVGDTLESEDLESEDQESEGNDASMGSVVPRGPKFSKGEREQLQKLLALKKQADADQRSQAMAGDVSVLILTFSI